MYQFEREGKRVFINDDRERERHMRSTKYATVFDDGTAQSLRSSRDSGCNIHYLPYPLRPVNNGMAFQKNSVYREVFSDAYVLCVFKS